VPGVGRALLLLHARLAAAGLRGGVAARGAARGWMLAC
jgi:hypothetical protein